MLNKVHSKKKDIQVYIMDPAENSSFSKLKQQSIPLPFPEITEKTPKVIQMEMQDRGYTLASPEEE